MKVRYNIFLLTNNIRGVIRFYLSYEKQFPIGKNVLLTSKV